MQLDVERLWRKSHVRKQHTRLQKEVKKNPWTPGVHLIHFTPLSYFDTFSIFNETLTDLHGVLVLQDTDKVLKD